MSDYKNYLLKQIKETESNIKNWYIADGESELLSNYYLRLEKKYLRSLKNKLIVAGGSYNDNRIEKLMDSIECF